jgi:hypothetical protein
VRLGIGDMPIPSFVVYAICWFRKAAIRDRRQRVKGLNRSRARGGFDLRPEGE